MPKGKNGQTSDQFFDIICYHEDMLAKVPSGITKKRTKLAPEPDIVDLILAHLKNIHVSLKWFWQTVMAVVLTNAIGSYIFSLKTDLIKNPMDFLMNPKIFLNLETFVFICFILAFIRFYFGDSRYLDLSYSELEFYHGLEKEIAKFSGFKRMSDIFLLLFHGIFFYFMSEAIGKPGVFLCFFTLLLLVNVFWLQVQIKYKFGSQGIRRHRESNQAFFSMSGLKPLILWRDNNLLFIAIVAILESIRLIFEMAHSQEIVQGIYYSWYYFFLLLLCLGNSFRDFQKTWEYYFPPLKEKKELVGSDS